MTKHRTITGFVAVALVAVAATAFTMRSNSPWSQSPWAEGLFGSALSKGPTVDPGQAPAANFDDRWSAMADLPQASR